MEKEIRDLIEKLERSIYINSAEKGDYTNGRIDGFKDVVMFLKEILSNYTDE